MLNIIFVQGSGVGGSLASLHLLSPLSCNLYNNMIIQSGSPFSNVITMEEALKRTKTLAHLVGCDQSSMLDCLRRIDAQVLINQELSVSDYSLNMEPFPPIIDGQFLLEDPEVLISNKIFKKCPILIGTNANEGLSEMMEYLPELGLQANLFELDSDQLNSGLSRMFKSFTPALLNLIKFQYGMFSDDETQKTKVKRFFGLQSALADKEVSCKVDQLAKIYAKDGNNVFRYYFNPLDDNVLASEFTYILGEPFKSLGKDQGGMSKIISSDMIKYWSQFSKFDSPSIDQEETIDWPRFEEPNYKYIKFEDESYDIGHDIRERVCLFWKR